MHQVEEACPGQGMLKRFVPVAEHFRASQFPPTPVVEHVRASMRWSASTPGHNFKVKKLFCFKLDAMTVPEALATTILIL